eukprot:1928793-Rhodomonas_salina.1
MVSASSDKTIRVWNVDVDAGKLHCVEVLDQGSACFWCDFDGKKLLCSGFGFIRQFDVISQSEVRCALFCRRIILTSRASAEFDAESSSYPDAARSDPSSPLRQEIAKPLAHSDPKLAIRPRGSAHFGGPKTEKDAAKLTGKAKAAPLKRINS